EERDGLLERCAALEERSARLLDEIAVLRGRADVDLPHWAARLRACRGRLEQAAAPFSSVPLGEKLAATAAELEDVEAGILGLNGAPLREELAELKRGFSATLEENLQREEALRRENAQLRSMLKAVGRPAGEPAAPAGEPAAPPA
ncbi:unnamed protein product, partial [Prorocentrum cordatum]